MNKNIKPDIISKIRFYSTEECSRKNFLNPQLGYIGCPSLIKGKYYDCRLLLFDRKDMIYPGETITVPIKFLDSNTVLNLLEVNDTFNLWDGQIFAEVEVIEIIK